MELAGKCRHLLRLVDGNADELQPPARIALLHFDEHGDLLAARSAPGGPVVHHQHAAAPLLEALGPSREVRDRRRQHALDDLALGLARGV